MNGYTLYITLSIGYCIESLIVHPMGFYKLIAILLHLVELIWFYCVFILSCFLQSILRVFGVHYSILFELLSCLTWRLKLVFLWVVTHCLLTVARVDYLRSVMLNQFILKLRDIFSSSQLRCTTVTKGKEKTSSYIILLLSNHIKK